MSLRPRSDEILDSIRWSFETFIVPELDDEYAASLGHTIVNLLRHLALRIELEGPALHAGNRELRRILTTLADHARTWGGALTDVSADIRETLSATPDLDGYPPVSALAEEADALGACLERALRALRDADDDVRATASYAQVRTSIRDHLRRQLEREATWIEPAFRGTRR